MLLPWLNYIFIVFYAISALITCKTSCRYLNFIVVKNVVARTISFSLSVDQVAILRIRLQWRFNPISYYLIHTHTHTHTHIAICSFHFFRINFNFKVDQLSIAARRVSKSFDLTDFLFPYHTVQFHAVCNTKGFFQPLIYVMAHCHTLIKGIWYFDHYYLHLHQLAINVQTFDRKNAHAYISNWFISD